MAVDPVSSSGGAQPTSASAAERAQREAQAGEALHASGHFAEARAKFADAIRLDPRRPDYHVRLAVAAWAQGYRPLIEPSLREAIRLAPNWATPHEALSQLMLEEGRLPEAREQIGVARQLAPDDFSVMVSHAYVLEQAGDAEAAWESVSEMVADGRRAVRLAILYSRMAAGRGHEQRALRMVSSLLDERAGTPREVVSLHYCATNLLDRMRQYDDAFAHARTAKGMSVHAYDPTSDAKATARNLNYFSARRLEALPRSTLDSGNIVFVVGMPRSGTSLVEQILAAHPAVHGAGELPHLTRVAYQTAATLSPLAAGSSYPECLDQLSLAKANDLAAAYLQPVLALAPGAQRIVDKMPMNLHYLGLAACLLPQARVIYCRRDPLDTCLSCYLTEFAYGHDYAGDLSHLGAYARVCDRTMRHWQSVLELRGIEVRYEDVVADPERESRRLIEFVGLPWDEQCLRFHESKRPVSTASTQQVRRPIYRSSVGRWKNYEKHLGPLRDALRDHGD